MSGNGKGFWAWHTYATANDDIRNKVIEEGWFGQKSNDRSFQQDVQQMEARHTADPLNASGGVQQGESEDWNAFYGQAQAEVSPDAQRDEADAFYGRDTDQPQTQDLYGQDVEPER